MARKKNKAPPITKMKKIGSVVLLGRARTIMYKKRIRRMVNECRIELIVKKGSVEKNKNIKK